MRQVCQNVRCVWQRAHQWLCRFVEQCHKCRSCGGRVALLEDICPNCGASNPSVIPISPSVLIITFGTAVLLTLLLMT